MVDIQNDEGLLVLKEKLEANNTPEVISLLKTASVDIEFDDIIDEAFADKENRMFPIFSPEMAAMSALYMQGEDVDELTKEACEKALKDWGIDFISLDSLEKQASEEIPEDMFLLPSKKKLPVFNDETLYKSASTLVSNFNSLSIADKVEASSNLYKIATEEYGMAPEDLDEKIIRYAQEAPCNLNKLADSVTERYAETHLDGYKDMIQKIASYKKEIGGSVSFDKSINAGIAYDLIMLDKEAGVVDIFDAVYDVHNSPFIVNEDTGELEKSASENTITIGDYTVTESQLYKVAEEDFNQAFPGSSELIFDGDSISEEKLENFMESAPKSAVNTIGEFIAGF